MRQRVALWAVLVVLTQAVVLGQSAVDIYQRALVLKDQAAGDLKEAIALYRRAATKAGSLIARSRPGRSSVQAPRRRAWAYPHAADTYALVVRTYTEQRESVATAQARLAVLRPSTGGGQGPASAASRNDVPAVVDVTIENYCVGCHNPRQRVAGLDLQTLRAEGLAANQAVWERVLQRLRARRDPPPDCRGPTTRHTAHGRYPGGGARPVLPGGGRGAVRPIDDAGLATRMAAFLWGGEKPYCQPDGRRAPGHASAGRDDQQQVRRMLKDARASAFVSGFLERWMLRDGLDRWQGPRHGFQDSTRSCDRTSPPRHGCSCAVRSRKTRMPWACGPRTTPS